MHHVDPASLDDLQKRVEYLRKFIDFTEDDAAALHAAKDVVAPLVPAIVDAVYVKLLSFDITAKSFVPRQTGYTGEAPTKLEDLNPEHPQIKFRKDFLGRYLVKLVTMDYSKPETWEYLDKVGLMHTGAAGFKHRISKPALRVEYIHCGILMGYVEDILVNTVITHPTLDIPTKNAVARAANKLLWIQNDLFARHYIKDESEVFTQSTDTVTVKKSTAAATALACLVLGAVYTKVFRS
ncbi:unnamed protein product [Cyclocybe aegerita]|uniref:Globin-sensor domain-containing protein n=1 Tax=Cyclocybe aegerita TaxID=1973307 RepID=A0A8S0W5T2_CYCAE|nr:unnamed protein product [Cyclocybe aegerita]